MERQAFMAGEGWVLPASPAGKGNHGVSKGKGHGGSCCSDMTPVDHGHATSEIDIGEAMDYSDPSIRPDRSDF